MSQIDLVGPAIVLGLAIVAALAVRTIAGWAEAGAKKRTRALVESVGIHGAGGAGYRTSEPRPVVPGTSRDSGA